MSSDYTVFPRSLYLIRILILPASSGSPCWTCSVQISIPVRHSIRQTDGQSKQMNQTVESLLRPYVERHLGRWSQHVALAVFAIRQRCQCGHRLHPILSQFWQPSHCSIDITVQRGCVKPCGSCPDNGGWDEDSPGGSSDQSLCCSKSSKSLC